MANFLISTAGGTISGTTTDDTVEFITGGSAATVRGFGGIDTVKATAGYGIQGITFFANTGDDILAASGANLISSNIQLGKGSDSALFGGNTEDVNNSTVKGKDGNDVITFIDDSGTASSLYLKGNQGNDTISFGTLAGTRGDGNVKVQGGGGVDTVNVTGAALLSAATLVGGLGEDTVTISGGTIAETDIILKTESKSADLDSANTLTVNAGTINSSRLVGGGAVDTLAISGGGQIAATLRAGAGNDIINISGGAGAFTTGDYGLGAGADVFSGGGFSTATINGGAGDDVLNISNAVSGSTIIGGLGSDVVSGSLGTTGTYIYLTGNTFFYNTSTESTIDSMDSIDLNGSNFDTNGTAGAAVQSGITFGFDTSFGNLSAVSGTTLTTGLAQGLATSVAINSGTVVFSGGQFDNASDSTVTSIAKLLDAGLTQAGDSVVFTNTGIGGDLYLFIEKGDNDLVVTLDNQTGANGASSEGVLNGVNLVVNNSNTSITLTL